MISEPLATTSFVPIPDDYVAIHALTQTKSNTQNRWTARFVLWIACWSANMVSLSTVNACNMGTALTGAVISLIFIWVFTKKWWPDPEKSAARHYRPTKNPELYQRRTIRLEESGTRLITEMYDCLYRWLSINRVTVTEQHLFLFARGGSTLFVPARAFTSNDEFLSFVRIAQSRYIPTSEEAETTGGFPVLIKDKTLEDAEPSEHISKAG